MKRNPVALLVFIVIIMAIFAASPVLASAPAAQADNPNPPEQAVRLIFIHHSTGENWLVDDNGGLGLALANNNYFVSDTNYGWGPDTIGDRTDIPNWLEWFRSENTGRIMQAVYAESGQNSAYTRTGSNPGGENQVIMFKSCFPNSELAGSPNDPATPGSDLTVGNAKYVYNEILKYFVTRPDKLFVVITAPPVSNPENAANARAFNQWLVNDWLRENGYSGNNVAVFDFYNILTGPDNHTRYSNGQIEHVFTPGMNTAYYPSEDDHPSHAGNQKATTEFLPMLNIFYHRWQENAPAQPPAATQAPPAAGETQPPATEEAQLPDAPQSSPSGGMIDNFDAGSPPGTNGWESNTGEGSDMRMSCAPAGEIAFSGKQSLKMDFNVSANSWATCTVFFDSVQNWSRGEGVSFYLQASKSGLVFDVDLYAGSMDSQETYAYTIETSPESTTGWMAVDLPWEQFHRVEWEENGGAVFEKPGKMLGFGFGFGTPTDAPNTGVVSVDELRLMGTAGQSEQAAPTAAQQPASSPLPTNPLPAATPADQASNPLRRLVCGNAAALPVMALAVFWWSRRRKTGI